MSKQEFPSHSRDLAQSAVDYLFGVTRMPVVLTDGRLNVLASSVHHTTDANRRRAILERRTPAPSRRFVEHLGDDLDRGCTTIPAQPGIGMDLERWCVPVLEGPSSLYFWLLREGEDGGCGMDQAVAAALDMGGTLRRLAPAATPNAELVRRCVDGLLDEDPAVHDFARRRLDAAGLPVVANPDVSVVRGAAAGQGDTEKSCEQLLGSLETARLSSGAAVGRYQGGAVVISDPDVRPQMVRVLSDLIRSSSNARPTAGITRMREGESLLAAARRAGFMARVATLPECDDLMQWESAGPWAVLSGVALSWESVDQFSPGCRELVLDKPHLAQTALAHLESSGVDSTAERLSIHRTTLYYRLKQVDRVLGAGWDEGWRRAGTHSSLQLGRLLHVLSAEQGPVSI
jgi:hypothetical protein